MKKIIILFFVSTLAGCAGSPPKQVQPQGALSPVYPYQEDINERIY